MAASRGYQHRHQRLAWNTKAAAEATKKPMWKHRSLSTPPLLEACAAHHCQSPVNQGHLPWENTRCASGWFNITPHSVPLPPPSLSEPETLISCYFNPVLCEGRTDALRRPTCRGGAKYRAEPQELFEKRREREISPSILRSSGLNLHNHLDVPCICGIPE